MKNENLTKECRYGREELLLYRYGEFGEDARVALEGHLASCEPCRKSLEELGRVLDFASSARLELPERAAMKFASRLPKEKKRFEARFHRGWQAGAWAAAAALVLAVFLPGEGVRPPRTAPLKMAEVEVLNDMEFLQDMEVLQHLELLQELEPLR